MNARRLSSLFVVVALAACSDASLSPTEAPGPITQAAPELISEGEGIFQRYVAIGTSISMGVASDGVYAASQQNSWPAQLARLAHRDLSLPLIQAPGCSAPFAAPLMSGRRDERRGGGPHVPVAAVHAERSRRHAAGWQRRHRRCADRAGADRHPGESRSRATRPSIRSCSPRASRR